MVLPAALYLAINAGRDGVDGWGIPMATDIAFAVGVLALLGSRAPSSLKLFLLSLAIVDDIGAIVLIAVVYSSDVDPAAWRSPSRRSRWPSVLQSGARVVAADLRGAGGRVLARHLRVGRARRPWRAWRSA